MKSLLVWMVKIYQWTLSPLLAALNGGVGGCRFTPTCSEYAIRALQIHGAARGTWLTIRRLLRCHPWGGHGFDPVPGESPSRSNNHAAHPSGDHPSHPPHGTAMQHPPHP